MSTTAQTDEKLKILLVEDDSSACSEFIKYIDSLPYAELIGITNSSFEAFELVRSKLPDALILDLELHEGSGNGLLLLNDMRTLDPSLIPYTVITTNNTSNTTYESARQLGADFIFTKHQTTYSAQSVVDFIHLMEPTIRQRHSSASTVVLKEASADYNDRRRRKQLCEEFDALGMKNRTIGYQYLMDAVCITIEKQTINIPFVLAKQYNKTPASIERAMQHAITSTWDHIPLDDLSKHYTAHVNPAREKPTIMEFVSFYANKLKGLGY